MDGKVVISTALDNSGIERDSKQMGSSVKSQVMKMAQEYRKQGMTMSDAMRKAWSEIERTSQASSKRVGANLEGNIGGSLDNVVGSFGGLQSVLGKLTATIATAFSVHQVIQFGVESSKAAMQLSNALTGLQSILDGQGRSFSNAKDFIEEYTADGLIPATNAITAYKNLAMRGYDDSQIQQVMVALKDASAFGRQASMSMGEAVESASEGLKNENSILVDNAGVTKNVAKMWEDYAASIGTTAANLTQQQKIQAEVTGILEESKYQVGDAAKVAGNLSGQLQQLSFNFNNLKIAAGNIVNPILQAVLPAINTAITAFTRLANAIASVMGALFGSVSVTSSAAAAAGDVAAANNTIAESAAAGADAQKDLAKGVAAAGKAAKKSLAGFDELNKLQDNSSSGGGGSGGSGGGGSSGGAASEGTVEATTDVTDTISPKIQALVDKIHALLEPLQNIDLEPLRSSFSDLGGAIAAFGKMIGKHLQWYWFNVLVPLAEWTIEEAAPAGVDLLTGTFELLTAALDPVISGIEKLWQKVSPVIIWLRDTAVKVIETVAGNFHDFAALLEEKGPQIEETLSNMGTILQEAWQGYEPALAAVRDLFLQINNAIVTLQVDRLGVVIDSLAGISSILAGFSSGNWSAVWEGMSTLAVGKAEYIEKRAGGMFEKLGIDISGLSETVDKAMKDIGTFFTEAWDLIEEAWEGAAQWFDSKVVQPIRAFFAPLQQWFGTLFGNIWETVSQTFANISEIGSGCKAILETAWQQFWENLRSWAREAWAGVQDVFGTVGEWFGETFGEAWERVKKVFSTGGEVFDGIKEGIVSSFKAIVNKLISGINRVVAVPFNGLNSAIRTIRNVSVLGMYPFSGLSTISVPSIPYLAQGAVLPANKPFMAVVGDQRHGTNVEAPLATIQEAVAAVMGDMVASNMAGHEATVDVLREILEAILEIQIGDDVIGQAVDRYHQKMVIMRGV